MPHCSAVLHPIDDRILLDPNRFTPAIEQGKQSFSFRLSYDPAEKLENNAQEFVNTPYSLNFFPHGSGNAAEQVLSIDNPAISLSACYENEDGYTLRLINNNPVAVSTALTLQGKAMHISFEAYEVKTFIYSQNAMIEKAIWL